MEPRSEFTISREEDQGPTYLGYYNQNIQLAPISTMNQSYGSKNNIPFKANYDDAFTYSSSTSKYTMNDHTVSDQQYQTAPDTMRSSRKQQAEEGKNNGKLWLLSN